MKYNYHYCDQTHGVLYILMRSDLTSMGSGMKMVQAAHAANQFIAEAAAARIESHDDHIQGFGSEYRRLVGAWQDTTVGKFGKTIVVDVGSGKSLRNIIRMFNEELRLRAARWNRGEFSYPRLETNKPQWLPLIKASIVNDPSYIVQDGEVEHIVDIDTCGYVFGPAMALRELLSKYSERLDGYAHISDN